MNATTATATTLPAILDQPNDSSSGRREHVQDFVLGLAEVDRFNRLLARLGRAAPLDRDQLATAARELCARSKKPDAEPACIDERMQRVPDLSRMISDRDWIPANDVIDVAAAVVDYVGADDDLIPDRLRRIGRLDDAIVIETAWPKLADELARYRDYRRLQLVEASLRGRDSFRFTRTDWESARAAEAALQAHQRRVRAHSYVPVAASLFQIH